MPFDSSQKQALFDSFEAYAKDSAIEVISLSTTDGFSVQTLNKANQHLEPDSLSAAASTLHSVSNAVAQQILGKRFKVTFIEAQQGNVAFVDLTLGEDNYVLVMSADQSMNIATLRLRITRLAEDLQQTNTPASATTS